MKIASCRCTAHFSPMMPSRHVPPDFQGSDVLGGEGTTLVRREILLFRRKSSNHRLCKKKRWSIEAPLARSVAQSGSAPRSGRGGRVFESLHSDQLEKPAFAGFFRLRARFFSRLAKLLSSSRRFGGLDCSHPRNEEGMENGCQRGRSAPGTVTGRSGRRTEETFRYSEQLRNFLPFTRRRSGQ